MRRILSFAIVLFLIYGNHLRAANPDDIEFRARLVKENGAFHMGESVEMEISYSSQDENKYEGTFSGPNPSLAAVTPRVTPADGVFEMNDLRRARSWVGSILSSSAHLGTKPFTQQMDLSQWFRFQKPGHFSVVITSIEVSRIKSAEEGGGKEPVTLESNPVEFDILPADPAWVAGQLSKIDETLNTKRDVGERAFAINHLALLDTPASAHHMVQLYLASAAEGEDWQFDSGLRESSQIDVIIPVLENTLSNPTAIIPSGLPDLLADLQTRKELGVVPAYPSDAAEQEKWKQDMKGRTTIDDKYLAQANALLKASIDRRTGPQKAAAIYQMWLDATQLNGTDSVAVEELARLESNVLTVASDLNHIQQIQFVNLAWQTMPHLQLLPLVRKLANDDLTHVEAYDSHEAFQLWCGETPDECGEAILQNILEKRARTDKNLILLMAESEHPELDKMIEAQLKDPATLHDWDQSQRTAAVILRAGSRNIVPAVETFMDQIVGPGRCEGITRGELFGYLFRASPEDGAKRLTEELQVEQNSCGSELLRTLHQVRPSDDIIPVVTRALNSPNLEVAQTAALYLGEHGADRAEDALWRRLEELWGAWQDRSPEHPNEMSNFDRGVEGQTARLEQGLASALSHASNWKLNPAEIDRLHSGCLTQPCRDIADGKMSLGL